MVLATSEKDPCCFLPSKNQFSQSNKCSPPLQKPLVGYPLKYPTKSPDHFSVQGAGFTRLCRPEYGLHCTRGSLSCQDQHMCHILETPNLWRLRMPLKPTWLWVRPEQVLKGSLPGVGAAAPMSRAVIWGQIPVACELGPWWF